MKRRREEIIAIQSKSNSPTTHTCSYNNNGDVYSRTSITSTKGRGSLSGWVTCPLCNNSGSSPNTCSTISTKNTSSKSQKKFSLGRGISMHLQQVHTPWKPGKGELARRERIRRRVRGMVHGMFRESKDDYYVSGNNNDNHHAVNLSSDQSAKIDDNCDDGGDVISEKRNNSYFGNAQDLHVNQFPSKFKHEKEQDYYIRVLKTILGKVWNKSTKKDDLTWTPTQEEVQEWDEKVLDLSKLVEQNAQLLGFDSPDDSNSSNDTSCVSTFTEDRQPKPINNDGHNGTIFIPAGYDRNGEKVQSYKESLPPFIKAASEGNLSLLKEMIQKCHNNSYNNDMNKQREYILKMINTKDRNGSIADHWCAGNGHLDCLKYVLEQRHIYSNDHQSSNDNMHVNKKRKRDGKTSLHYASRNGHDNIINYLLGDDAEKTPSYQQRFDVDVISNDSTSPLHLACYGGHASTIKLLVTKYKADILQVNSWRCGIGHWLAMTVQTNDNEITSCLDFVKDYLVQNPVAVDEYITRVGMVDEVKKHLHHSKDENITTFHMFGLQQGQGHSAVHKACQKRNHTVMKWLMKEAETNWNAEEIKLAGKVDNGGNKPHKIWMSMDNSCKDEHIVQEMKSFGW